jgi:transcriptional regulator GlxA family with amidase domain
VQSCEAKLKEDYRRIDAITRVLAYADIPERTLKRRFILATGSSLLEYIQNLRIEEAKRLLESHRTPVEEISVLVG